MLPRSTHVRRSANRLNRDHLDARVLQTGRRRHGQCLRVRLPSVLSVGEAPRLPCCENIALRHASGDLVPRRIHWCFGGESRTCRLRFSQQGATTADDGVADAERLCSFPHRKVAHSAELFLCKGGRVGGEPVGPFLRGGPAPPSPLLP